MNIRNWSKISVFVALVLLAAGCSDSGKNPTGSGGNATLTAHWQGTNGISAFLSQKCTPCHTAQTQNGFNVSSYANITSNANGDFDVKPGDPANSYIIHKLEGDPNAGQRMPQGGPYLTAAEIDTIKAWIQAGALNN